MIDAEHHAPAAEYRSRARRQSEVHRTHALVLCLGLTSCSVRLGSEIRSTPPAPRPPAAPRPARTLPDPLASHTLGRRHPRPAKAPSDASSVAQRCVDEINRYRATLGLRPLERASDREACADGQIADDARSGQWHGRFGACGESAQNECNASPTSREDMIVGCLRGMWSEGPGGGHYENMKSPTATKVWCGFHTTPSGDVWSVQDFR